MRDWTVESRRAAGIFIPGRPASELREATRSIAVQEAKRHPFQQFLADLDFESAIERMILPRPR